MNAKEFLLAVARYLDRETGMSIARNMVDEYSPLLNRVSSRLEMLHALRQIAQMVDPYVRINIDGIPFSARLVAQIILAVLYGEDHVQREVFVREPTEQRLLTVSLRVFLNTLTSGTRIAEPPPPAPRPELPPRLELEIKRMLQRPITAKA